jgi:hypothetical protein
MVDHIAHAEDRKHYKFVPTVENVGKVQKGAECDSSGSDASSDDLDPERPLTSQEKRDRRRERARLRLLEFKGTNHCSLKESSKKLAQKRKHEIEKDEKRVKKQKKGKKGSATIEGKKGKETKRGKTKKGQQGKRD